MAAGAQAWPGAWPGRLNPESPHWRADATRVWGEPGFQSDDAQTHFVPGADGAALALMLIGKANGRLERIRIECMGEYVSTPA